MKKESLRKINVKELEWNNRPNYEFEEFTAYFHKWFEQKEDDKTQLMAIVEMEDGKIRKINSNDYRLRFFTQEDINLENSKGWGV